MYSNKSAFPTSSVTVWVRACVLTAWDIEEGAEHKLLEQSHFKVNLLLSGKAKNRRIKSSS